MATLAPNKKITKQGKSIWGKLAGSVLGYLVAGPAGSAAGSTILGNVFQKGGKVKLIDPGYFEKKKGKRGGAAAYKKGGLVKGSAEAKAYMAKIRKMKK